jgi:sugar fermentation stimulation protein A
VRFDPPLTRGTFLRRYKRFFVDVEVPGLGTVVAHCPNTGRLTGLLREGAPVLIKAVDKPDRKLKWTWTMVQADRGWVGVDTGIAPALVQEAIVGGVIPELAGYDRVIPEVKYGRDGGSRIDLLLSRGGDPEPARKGKPRAKPGRQMYLGDERVYVEVKNTTLVEDRGNDRIGAFPDAPTERGRKHLEELMWVVSNGGRGAMVFSLQRSDCSAFVPADSIDPAYGKIFRRALEVGVEAYAVCPQRVGATGLRLTRTVPVRV